MKENMVNILMDLGWESWKLQRFQNPNGAWTDMPINRKPMLVH